MDFKLLQLKYRTLNSVAEQLMDLTETELYKLNMEDIFALITYLHDISEDVDKRLVKLRTQEKIDYNIMLKDNDPKLNFEKVEDI